MSKTKKQEISGLLVGVMTVLLALDILATLMMR